MGMTDQIPMPSGKPITGQLLEFRKQPLDYLYRLSKEYDDIVKLRFGLKQNVYVLFNPDYIEEVLIKKQASFQKAKTLQLTKDVLGEGLVTSEGEKHLQHRRHMQPLFQPKHIAHYAQTMINITEEVIANWQEGKVYDIHQEMMALTLKIINQTMFGSDIDEHIEQIRQAIDTGMNYITEKSRSLLSLDLNTTKKIEYEKAIEELNTIIYEIIEKRLKSSDLHERHDLLSRLLSSKVFSPEEVRDEVTTIFIAGHETTANTLSWAWYLLSKNPEAEKLFVKELKEVLQGKSMTLESYERLTYTKNIVYESLRMYPPAWKISREAIEDVQIGPYSFQKGDMIFMSQYAVHHNDKYFKEPFVFRPERFSDGSLDHNPQFSFFPFGGGPRVCIGNHFAHMEATLLLATIGQKYKLTLPENVQIDPEPLVTLRPKQPLMMKIEPRS